MEKKVNIFEREVTVFKNIKFKEPSGNVTIFKALTEHGCKDLIDKYRETKTKEDKHVLPVFTCSGVFKTRTNDGLKEHNGVICIDIDEKDNTDVKNFDEISSLIGQIPYVAYCGHSCGGVGYFVLMPIEDSGKHLQHYESACDDFERCGITVDRSCKNVSRTRFISYDNDAYYNNEAAVYSRTKAEVEITSNIRVKELETKQLKYGNKKLKTKRSKRLFGTYPELDRVKYENIKSDVEFIIMLIEREKIDITATYNDWQNVGAALANQFGEDGRKYFQQVSRFHPKYNRMNNDFKFKSFAKLKQITIGTFFYIAKKYGLECLFKLSR